MTTTNGECELAIVPGPIDKIHDPTCRHLVKHGRRSTRAEYVTGTAARIVAITVRNGHYPYARQCDTCKPLNRRWVQ